MQSPVSGLLLGQSQEVPSLVDNPRPRSTLASLPLQEVRREQSLAVAEALPTLRANDGSLPVRKQQVETEQRLSAVSLPELVERHRQEGDLIAIVTATNEFVTRPIAEAFGVADLIAVNLVRDDAGRVTGEIHGVPSFREGKIIRVEQWLASLGRRLEDFPRVSFYSDSPNDLPLLERVNDPVATNPSPALESVAQARGWRLLRLFA